jgi:hypothetical protein
MVKAMSLQVISGSSAPFSIQNSAFFSLENVANAEAKPKRHRYPGFAYIIEEGVVAGVVGPPLPVVAVSDSNAEKAH